MRQAFRVSDSWPLEIDGALFEVERENQDVVAISVSFLGQPTSFAPQVDDSGAMPHLQFGGILEQRARGIVRRFRDFVSLYHPVEIDIDHVDYVYEPESESEREEMAVFGFTLGRDKSPSWLPFATVAQAVFATDSEIDPSYAASMLRLGRASLASQQWIEGFRYYFMLVEGLFGDGKFKKESLGASFLASPQLCNAIKTTIENLRNDPVERSSPARKLLEKLPDPNSVVAYIVERRGFYFHGNLRRPDGWHPDRQKEAEPLCWLMAGIAQEVSFAFAAPMHAPDINSRYLKTAKAKGATMEVEVLFVLAGERGRETEEILSLDVPGTRFTSDLAFTVLKHACTWAEVNKLGQQVQYVMARNAATKEELFRTQLLPAPNT